MNEQNNHPDSHDEGIDSANDRFKRSFSSWFWGSMTAATVLHFIVFAFWPSLEADVMEFGETDIEVVEPIPEVEIPPPPEQIRRPQRPVITDASIDEDITIETTDFQSWDNESLAPPPERAETNDISQAPQFVVTTQDPVLLNETEVDRTLKREYPTLLKDAGISGTTVIHIFIDEDGVVQNTLIDESSGHKGLDDAALKIGLVAKFSPAKNRDKFVALWISMPITFTAR